ncbi:MAG: hypothetical protein IIC02_01100 [Planctomycetes bacterium]|nr:hypothetical protein [Planctomycetota bacterium]
MHDSNGGLTVAEPAVSLRSRDHRRAVTVMPEEIIATLVQLHQRRGFGRDSAFVD